MKVINGWSASFILFGLALLLTAFVFPVGLYPFQDELRDFLAFGSITALISLVLCKRKVDISIPYVLFFFPLFILLLFFSKAFSAPTVEFSYNWFYLAFLFASLVAVITASLVRTFGLKSVIQNFAYFLVILFFFSAFIGLLRYYGVLSFFIPLITEDGGQLMGPMGQPNLMAMVCAIGLAAVVYFYRLGRLSSKVGFSLFLSIFFVGALTASRSWYIAAMISLAPLLLDLINNHRRKGLSSEWFKLSRSKLPETYVLLIFIIVSFGAPKFDALISESLIKIGFLERETLDVIYQRKAAAGSSGRLSEWLKIVHSYDKVTGNGAGYGAGRYGVFSNEVTLEENLKGNGHFWSNSHNILITFLIEFGFLGLLLVTLFLFYLVFRVLKAPKTFENSFVNSVVFIFIFHSMVEFSLWYLPFLAVFIASATIIDEKKDIEVLGIGGRRTVSAVLLLFLLPFGLYVGKDIYTVIKVMYTDAPDLADQRALVDVSHSSIVGHGAHTVKILRFSPPLENIEYELRTMEKLVEWRPTPIYKMRHAVLLGAAGREEEACNTIFETISLYPFTLSELVKELDYLDSVGALDMSIYYPCISSSMVKWSE